MKITYSSNNSGGYWRLKDQDWKNLEAKGWDVDWEKERWLGALAIRATFTSEETEEDEAIEDAKASFTVITGQDVDEKGCNCCGKPHGFYASAY